MLNKILIIIFTLFPVLKVFSQHDFYIKGKLPDNSILSDNHAFLLNDECVFSIEHALNEEIKFRSFSWSLQGFDESASTRVTIQEENNALDYHFKLDTAAIDYRRFKTLKREASPNDSSVYFAAKIVFKGITETDKTVSEEVPVYLNLLPSRGEIKIISCYLPDGSYYYETKMKYDNFRNDTLKVLYKYEYWDGFLIGILIRPLSLANPFFDDYIDRELITTYQVISENVFGSVESAVINMNDLIDEYLIITSLNHINGSEIILYPNPAANTFSLSGNVSHIERIAIVDVLGRTLKTVSDSNEINISDLPLGQYVVVVYDKTNNKNSVLKLLKK